LNLLKFLSYINFLQWVAIAQSLQFQAAYAVGI
jgi:hypothetical protein